MNECNGRFKSARKVRVSHKQKQVAVVIFRLALLWALPGLAQPLDFGQIRGLVEAFKTDPRGPYQAIRWFCPDGTVILANERCNEPGGIQHALHKNVVHQLARDQSIYLGQILAGTPNSDFLNAANANSRLKQYQIEKYLQAIDDGWILRKARFYRGAYQAEDEEAWGLAFVNWLLAQDEIIRSQFFLARQISKDVPHQANDNRLTYIRALSKNISDLVPAFMDIRVKIHGQPEASDLQRVTDFRLRNREKLAANILAMLQDLEKELELAYQQQSLQALLKYTEGLPAGSAVLVGLKQLVAAEKLSSQPTKNNTNSDAFIRQRCRAVSELLWIIRETLLSQPRGASRLALMDLSNELEQILFRSVASWPADNIAALLEKNYVLAQAAAGCGFLEIWEWQAIEPTLRLEPSTDKMAFAKFSQKTLSARKVVEWSSGMVRATYGAEVALFSEFEPLAQGFIDERVRSSILLPLGQTAGELLEISATAAGISNQVMGIKNASQMHGLNPGLAAGELVVIPEAVDGIEFSSKKIYVLPTAPMDLKPVAGIATVSEGNLVSHVQLLARNLGIPNTVLTQQNLQDLLPFHGQEVFYAISLRGAVIMKPVDQMSAQERALVEERKRPSERIRVPTDRIDLTQRQLIRLSELRAEDSGRLCGPKAANLAQLKRLFPDNVGEGLVLPFGVFREHLDQHMAEGGGTYWQYLQGAFSETGNPLETAEETERQTLSRLRTLSNAIKSMPLLPHFRESLKQHFQQAFGAQLGELPVFIRSDTNMEDLKDFTGAGLNLTVFNVVEEAKIFQGILDVWASPYTERSYRWRQKYLLNPENVFPSILILPTVDVDKSGVMITAGLSSRNSKDATIAFNRGAGGAVDGQRAESYLLLENGENRLLSPSREEKYTILPKKGGTERGISRFNESILNAEELDKLRKMAEEIRTKVPRTPGIASEGPLDVELGFKADRLILFQVRPFVENKGAQASMYLRALDPSSPKRNRISLTEKI